MTPRGDTTGGHLASPSVGGTRAFVAGEAGAELIEFALTAVILLMTILGTLELGLTVWRYNMVSDLAQEGARWASVRGSTSLTPAAAAAVQTYVQSRANGIIVTATTSAPLVNVAGACSPTGASVNPSALLPGTGICVRVRTSYGPFSGLLGITGVVPLESTAKMVMAR